ncbi:methionine--tRNA ligase [Coprothermobacter platensis]|uniref:methionine--tRNA ligase n=1 Tax=Coprothermobacter platensis TaxID=108819 RepID=UPI00036DA983|nr:methionine--tRNA ligase [Coprothermobacter platensis]
MGRYYVTTPIYYVNAEPHAGSAYTTIFADALARYHRLVGDETFFLTGTDEHGQNIMKVASERGINPQAFVDEMSDKFKQAWTFLRISNDDFIRTTQPRHERVVQHAMDVMYKNGDIYLGTYNGWYCSKCETFYGENELVDGNCPIHHTPVEFVSEESYFFKWSKYQEPLLDLYKSNPEFVVPNTRLNEIRSFIERGLKDISVTRTSVPWGITVPFNSHHTVYVWFDALLNYISALGYGEENNEMKFWPGVHLIGKDILRHHAAMWPAMLMSLGLPVPKKVVAHGWWLVSGQKMSKSIGNIFSPYDLANHIKDTVNVNEDTAVDALRYFMLVAGPQKDDADLSLEALWNVYNADLANDFGNLLHRVIGFMKKKNIESVHKTTGGRFSRISEVVADALIKYRSAFENEDPQGALIAAMSIVKFLNDYQDKEKPWSLSGDDLNEMLYAELEAFKVVTAMLSPAMPSVSKQIGETLRCDISLLFGETAAFSPDLNEPPLFPRYKEEKVSSDTEPNVSETVTKKDEPAKDEQKPLIEYDLFSQVDLRVALIEAAERVPKSDKLIKLSVDLGPLGKRTVVAGIGLKYQPEELVGRRIIVVANLQPRKLMGVLSEGMLLAATGEDGLPNLLSCDGNPEPGTRIK